MNLIAVINWDSFLRHALKHFDCCYFPRSLSTTTRVSCSDISSSANCFFSAAMIEAHARKQALQEIFDFMDNWTEAEKEITRHLRPFGDPVKGINDIRRLLGESIAKCKVIPFPIRNSQSKSVMES